MFVLPETHLKKVLVHAFGGKWRNFNEGFLMLFPTLIKLKATEEWLHTYVYTVYIDNDYILNHVPYDYMVYILKSIKTAFKINKIFVVIISLETIPIFVLNSLSFNYEIPHIKLVY